jgi:hypothetical protein
LKLLGDRTQCVPGDRIELSVGVVEAEHPFRLLKWLDEAIQQDPIEPAVVPADAILVMQLPADGRLADDAAHGLAE